MANIINFISWLIPLAVVAGVVYFIAHKQIASTVDSYEGALAKKDEEESESRAEVCALLERLEVAESEASEVPRLKARLSEVTADLEQEKARLRGVASIDDAVKSALLSAADEVVRIKREASEKEISHNEIVAALKLEIEDLNETVRQREMSLASAQRDFESQELLLKKVTEDYQEAIDRLRSYSSASLVIKRSKSVRASGVLIQNRRDLNGTNS